MLHELLLALTGIPGDLIVFKNNREGFQVSPLIDFLHPVERNQITQLCAVGFQFRLLSQKLGILSRICSSVGLGGDWLTSTGVDTIEFNSLTVDATVSDAELAHHPLFDHLESLSGVYLLAICNGLNDIFLSYREKIVQLESTCFGQEERAFSLSMIQESLVQYPRIFAELQSFLNEMFSEPIRFRGAAILDILHGKCQQNAGSIAECMQVLYSKCLDVFWHQLSSWLLHGLLTDPYREFFIQHTPTTQPSTQMQVYAKFVEFSRSFDESPVGGDSSSGCADWSFEFSLRLSCLPLSVLSFDMANMCLFIGKAMRVLHAPELRSNTDSSLSATSIDTSQSSLSADKSCADTCPIPSEDMVAIAQLLQCLRDQPFVESLLVYQSLQQIQRCVASHLWNLIISQADLSAYLQAMKDYFLLGRGEFFQNFIEESATLMSAAPTTRAVRDINDGPFQSASSKCNIDDDKLFKLFRLKLHRSGFAFDFAKLLGISHHLGSRQSSSLSSDSLVSSNSAWQPNATTLATLSEEISSVGSTTWKQGSLCLCTNTPNQTGACWFNQQLHVDRGFSVQFQFVANPEFAEGFALVFQQGSICFLLPPLIQNHSFKCIGDGGNGLGYSGIPNSLAIEFDFKHNPEMKDLNSNHISVQTCWSQPNSANHRFSIASRSPSFVLADNKIHTVLVELKSGFLQVFVDDLSEEHVMLSVKCDLFRVQLEAGRAWVGFTAATSSLGPSSMTAVSDPRIPAVAICSWSFSEPGAGNHFGHAWRQLGLECHVESPLNLIFRPDVMTRYDSLFRFLFTVKRIQFSLQQAWLTLKSSRKSSWRELSVHRLLFCLRAKMQFLIDNLQYYLQVDVLEVQYAELISSLKKAHDFDSVRRAHDLYLSNLAQDSFLMHKQLLRSFENTFDSCLALCQLVHAHRDDNNEWTPEATRALIQIDQDFKTQSNFIYVMLTTATTSIASPHIGQLLLRLDYNLHYSAAAFISENNQR